MLKFIGVAWVILIPVCGMREQKTTTVNVYCNLIKFLHYIVIFRLPHHNQSLWSRGMIPASGAGGPGFDSPKRPCVALFAD